MIDSSGGVGTVGVLAGPNQFELIVACGFVLEDRNAISVVDEQLRALESIKDPVFSEFGRVRLGVFLTNPERLVEQVANRLPGQMLVRLSG